MLMVKCLSFFLFLALTLEHVESCSSVTEKDGQIDGKIFGRVLGNNVYFQIKWKNGDITCKANGNTFDGKPSYHTTYAQCPKWPKKDENFKITIELNGKKFETKPKDAIKEGKIQKHIKNTECQGSEHDKIDIGFIMDDSGSIKDNDWQTEKKIIKQIVALKPFGVKGIQAGVVTFHGSATLRIKISKSKTMNELNTELDKLSNEGGSTDILEGLDTALTQMFSKGNGMRSDSKKVAFLLTDGDDNSADSKYKAMKEKFKQRQILLKVIGVGAVNEQHLKFLVKQESDFVHGDDLKQFLNSNGNDVFDADDLCD